MRPVDEVVGVDEAVALAAGELTAPVARQQRAADRRRDRAGSSPDGERLPCAVRQRRATSEQSQASRRAVSGAIPGPSATEHAPGPSHGRARRVADQGLRVDVDARAGGARRRRARSAGGRARVSATAASDFGVGRRRRGGRLRFRGTARLRGGRRSRGTAPVSSRAPRVHLVTFLGQLLRLGGALGRERVARRLERLQEERPLLGRQLRLHVEAAVGVVPEALEVALAMLAVGFGGGAATRRADHPLELGRGRMARELDAGPASDSRIGDAGQRADLRVARARRARKSARISGSSGSARATRTCSRAAREVSPQRQATHSAVERQPRVLPSRSRRSNSPTSSNQRAEPALICAASDSISRSISSSGCSRRGVSGRVLCRLHEHEHKFAQRAGRKRTQRCGSTQPETRGNAPLFAARARTAPRSGRTRPRRRGRRPE